MVAPSGNRLQIPLQLTHLKQDWKVQVDGSCKPGGQRGFMQASCLNEVILYTSKNKAMHELIDAGKKLPCYGRAVLDNSSFTSLLVLTWQSAGHRFNHNSQHHL